MTATFKDIDSYLALQPENVRFVLEKLRQKIRSIVPDAEEVISYQMPTFKFHGALVGFAAFKNHCSFFPYSSKTLIQFEDDLWEFNHSKGTIRFTIEKPLPEEFVEKIVKMRMLQNLNKKTK